MVVKRSMPRVLVRTSVGIVAALLLSGCTAGRLSEKTRLAYDDARDALEAGDYPSAVRVYEKLLSGVRPGQIATLMSLEYAHALVRSGEPERALAVAREIETQGTDSAMVGRAKLVAAVAEHELAERAVAQAAPYLEARTRARAAFRRLKAVLLQYPQFDPQGVLIVRTRRLRELLAELEIGELRAQRDAAAARERANYILREFGDTAAAAAARALIQAGQEAGAPANRSPK